MNQNVKQLSAQLAGIWQHLGLNQRISIVMGAGVVLAGLFGLALWSSRVDYALLYGKLDDTESARVIAALEEAKVPYRISRAGGAIHVPADKVHSMRMQLATRGIPRGDGVGFEIFDKANFGISDFVQRANYLRAIQGELARTISQIDEVDAARVMIVLPENRLLADKQKQSTASVFVRMKGVSQLPPSSVNAIRFLVANSVEGLQASHVSVVDNQGNVLSENSDSDSIAGLSSTQLAMRRNLEQYLSKKAEGMLEKVLGPGQAVVRVAAEINFDTITRIEEKFDPDGQVPRTTTATDENTETTTGGANGGVPGVTTNAGTDTNATAATASPLNSSHTKKKVTNTDYEINKISSNTLQAAGGLKRVTAAVFVAAKFDGTGTDRKVVPREKEELDKLRRIVVSALGVQTGDPARKDEVALEEMPFNDQFATEVTQQLVQDEQKQYWWNLARNAGYPLLALVVLFLFWRAFRRTPVETIPIGVPVGQMAGGNGRNPQLWDQPAEPATVTVEVLNQLVRENPDNMTQALRTWLARNNPPPK